MKLIYNFAEHHMLHLNCFFFIFGRHQDSETVKYWDVNVSSNWLVFLKDAGCTHFPQTERRARSSAIMLDIDTVLREHLRFLTEDVTQYHNGGFVGFSHQQRYTSGIERWRAVPDNCPSVQNEPCFVFLQLPHRSNLYLFS